MAAVIECKHVTYVHHGGNGQDDMVVVKERHHQEDGTWIPKVRCIENPKRTFWITKKGQRTHKTKKLVEDLDNVIPFTSTQRHLVFSIAQALGDRRQHRTLKSVCESPYVYGVDVSIEALVKQKYNSRPGVSFTENSVAVLDIETCMTTKAILMCTVTFKDKAICAITRSFVERLGTPKDILSELNGLLERYLGTIVKARGLVPTFVFVDTPAEGIREVMAKVHTWKPDFLAIWNMDFDLPIILKTLEAAHIDPASVFSDPEVPKPYQYCKYIQGQAQRTTANGTVKNLAPSERWHVLVAPASFYVIDAMCVYRIIRTAAGLLPSYSLDAILDRELGMRKLTFSQADHITNKGQWHEFMQQYYPLEYVIYNLFDCIGVELLDEKVKDLSVTISSLCGYNEYSIFPRQPRRACNNLHFFSLRYNKVFASTPPIMREALDDTVVSTEHWIVTLKTHLVRAFGLKCLVQFQEVRTYIRTHTADLDLEATYPTLGIIFNIGKEQTVLELCRVHGVTEQIKRRATLNMSAPHMNAIEIFQDILNAPTHHDLLQLYLTHRD